MITWNGFLVGFLVLFSLQILFSLALEHLNLRYCREKGKTVPSGFEKEIDPAKWEQSQAYLRETTRFDMVSRIFRESLLLAILLSGVLPFWDRITVRWQMSWVPAGWLFLLFPAVILWLADLPFDYYHTFVVEEKFGFNRSSRRTWLMDQWKSGLLGLLLFSLVVVLLLVMIRLSPRRFWLWGFFILSGFQLLLVVLYPVLIAPLFNRFVPVQDQTLTHRIQRLMEAAAIPVKGIFQMDAGKRSAHTNAYFTGLGKTKRIVLYDTLLQQHPPEEILAVLAHEAGHFKQRHIWKEFLIAEAGLFLFFYLAYQILKWPGLYAAFGFQEQKIYIGLLILGIAAEKAGFFLLPLFMALSRLFERQADAFAVKTMGTARSMISALKRLAADNLSNLIPHPLYVRFHYSHPPIPERVAYLQGLFREDPAKTKGPKGE